MYELLGYIITSLTISWGIIFLFSYDLTTREKINLGISWSVFFICLVVGIVLIKGGI